MTASVWTEDRVTRLRALWREGWTAEQIAAEFGPRVSRSAVLGKVFRLGLSAHRPCRMPRSRVVGASGIARRTMTIAASLPARPEPVVRTERDAEPKRVRPLQPAVPPSGSLELRDLRRGQCRWPYGPDGGATTFCGQPVSRGAYCAGHAAVGYSTPRAGAPSLLALAGLGLRRGSR